MSSLNFLRCFSTSLVRNIFSSSDTFAVFFVLRGGVVRSLCGGTASSTGAATTWAVSAGAPTAEGPEGAVENSTCFAALAARSCLEEEGERWREVGLDGLRDGRAR